MRSFVLSLCLLLALPALAGDDVAAVRKQAEYSMLVNGHIVLGPDGLVQSHDVAPSKDLTPELLDMIARAAAQWRFEPVLVDGKAVGARVAMSMRLVASREDKDNYHVRISALHFGSAKGGVATDGVQGVRMAPPRYPEEVLRMGGKGTVYLIVQVGRDGKVLDVGAEQVNLRVAGTSDQMDQMRKSLTTAAIRAARRWTFSAPTTGPDAAKASWFVRVPVSYEINREQRAQAGEWDVYIPGPRNMDLPWAREALRLAGAPDALPGDGVYPLDDGPRLLGPPAT